MEDKNIKINLFIRQLNQSNALGYNKRYIASTADYNFKILDRAYEGTGRVYAKLKTAINNNNCSDPICQAETMKLKYLMEAPRKSLKFLSDLGSQLLITEDNYYDVNQNYQYAVAHCILTGKPTFAKSDGYNVTLMLKSDGSQELIFEGPMLEQPLIVNSDALAALLESNTNVVAETPDVNKNMLALLANVGIMAGNSINPDTGELSPQAKIADEFVLKDKNGQYIYEVVEIGDGMGRNILQFDLDKIERKITPLINAEVAGMLTAEQSVVAAWNVFIGAQTSVEEDDQMAQNANAGFVAWSYDYDLPLMPDKKNLFMNKYKEYFMNNYLKQFTTNKLPTVKADAVPFQLETEEVKEENKEQEQGAQEAPQN
tara:strand:- start:1364 stop:2479 length:1116 start_codon:yes stop_codon:yes gene_type:complete